MIHIITSNYSSAICSRCGESHKINTFNFINTSRYPELKQGVLDGSLFLWECPHCGARNLITSPVAYIDPDARIIILYSENDLSLEAPSDGEFSGFEIRHVREIGSLIEKAKIADAGLDDKVIELCKRVICMEKGEDLPLKFLRTEGSAGDMIFTYPQDGQMEMLALGFNVYEDCCAILAKHENEG